MSIPHLQSLGLIGFTALVKLLTLVPFAFAQASLPESSSHSLHLPASDLPSVNRLEPYIPPFSSTEPLSLEVLTSAERNPLAEDGESLTEDALAGENIADTASLSDPDPMAQLNSVAQLSDVQPTDWAFAALQSLVEQYGCIVGFPPEVYRGHRSLTRFEFAAGLNACLNRMEQQLAAAIAPLVTPEERVVAQRLQEEFAAELATLRGQVESLETRVQGLGATFSATTQLRGESVFALQDLWGGSVGADNTLVFQGRNTLVFDTSFSGDDRLRASIQAGNFRRFELPDESSEARVAFDTDTEEAFEINDVFYEFPINDRVNVVAIARGGNFGSIVESINPLASSGQGALSRFAQRNPILRGSGFKNGAGAGVSFDLWEGGLLSLGYISSDSSNPEAGNGLFNGGYGVGGQLVITPGDFALRLQSRLHRRMNCIEYYRSPTCNQLNICSTDSSRFTSAKQGSRASSVHSSGRQSGR